MIPRVLTLAVVALLSLAGLAHAAPQDVQVGALRAPLSRGGVALKEEARMASKALGNVAYGTRMHVEAVDGLWIRVTAKVADGTSKTGWMRSADTVEPYALTGAGRTGAVGEGTGPRVSGSEVSAAARGFGPTIEEQMALGDAQMAAALAVVTAQVEGVKPTPEAVSAFAKQGRLGRPGRVR